MWRELVQNYARFTREFSDAVARLGQHQRVGPETLELMREIEHKRDLCILAGDKLRRHIGEQQRADLGPLYPPGLPESPSGE